MKVLVVGGTSALGRALVPALAPLADVVTAGRHDCDVALDLLDAADRIVVPPGTDVVVQTAAHFGGPTPDEWLTAVDTNVTGTSKLCRACEGAGVRHLVLISSQSAVLDEASPYFNVYALTKRQGEDAARHFCGRHSIDLTILRPSQIYGNGDSFRPHQPLIHAIVDRARRGEDVVLFGGRDALRNYIHVDDLTRAMVDVVRQRVTGLYSCMYPADVAYSAVAEAAYAAWGTAGRVRFEPDKPDIPDNVFPADNTLYERLGWSPSIDIREGMKRIARDLQCAP